MFVCLFVCLFVWVKPENLYFAPCVWREVITPGNGCTRSQVMWCRSYSDTDHARDTRDSGTDQVLVNQWLTLYKLTGWLVSLDLRKPP